MKQNENNQQGQQEKITPKLRFPEFQTASGWDKKILGELFSERKEKGYPNLLLLSLTEQDGIIPQSETNRKNNSSLDKSKYLRVCYGDIAYNTMRMWEGRSAFVDMEGIVSPAYTICTPKNNVNSFFYSYYFKLPDLISEFHHYSQGLVKDTLNLKFDRFSQISIAVPSSPEEQQKIADCLSSLDELIELQEQKLAALQKHKKGLMQQLFPSHNDLQASRIVYPKLRFPQFKDCKGWEVVELDNFCELNPSNNGLPNNFIYIDLESVSSGTLVKKNMISLEEAPSRAQRLLENDDVIFQMVRPYQRNNYYCQFNDSNYYVASTGYAQLRKKDSGRFLFQLVHTDNFVNAVLKKCTGSNYPAINSSALSSINIAVPTILGEQQAIADCLSLLDSLINEQSQQIGRLKAHKKGLMQQLFPAMDEIN